jgi:hypothetical protein
MFHVKHIVKQKSVIYENLTGHGFLSLWTQSSKRLMSPPMMPPTTRTGAAATVAAPMVAAAATAPELMAPTAPAAAVPAATLEAAAAAEVLPVEAQIMAWLPSSTAFVTAMVIPRSLKEPVFF